MESDPDSCYNYLHYIFIDVIWVLGFEKEVVEINYQKLFDQQLLSYEPLEQACKLLIIKELKIYKTEYRNEIFYINEVGFGAAKILI